MNDILIPKDFIPIALSDIRNNVAIIYYNDKSQKFLFVFNKVTKNGIAKNLIGPIDVYQLQVFHHVLTDVLEMKGNYNRPINIPKEYEST